MGGESLVYALDDERILRIRRSMPEAESIARQKRFLDAIARRLPFATPVILEIGKEGYTIEQRLPGRPMTERLRELTGAARVAAFESYFAAATAMARLTFADRPYGYLLADRPLVATDWPAFVRLSLDRYIARNRHHLPAAGDPDMIVRNAHALIDAVPRLPPHVLVHGDFFPGNVMMDEDLAVTAVIDFSTFTLVGDPLFEIAGAVIFPEMLETTKADQALLRGLALDGYGPAVLPVFPAYRAYFAIAMAEPTPPDDPYPLLYPWALRTLRALAEGRLEAFEGGAG